MDREIKKYCNPVPFSDGKRHTNPDPYVMRWCGKYYCYATDEAGVKISVSDDLVHWNECGYGIRDEAYRDYWAPSVFYTNGKFYMYYSNIPKEETDNHQEWLKVAVSDKPEGPFVWKKTFFDKFSIDSHPFMWNEKLYMFYSVNDWIGSDDRIAGTVIVMDEMVSPYEFAGKPQPVLLPSLEQEIFQKNRFGDGRDWYTIEGAATVVHGNKCYLTYSANAYVNVDYFVGTAVAENKMDMRKMKWKKYPSDYEWKPLLVKNEKVEGTGHNTIVKAPNMVDDWIVYHGRMAEEKLIPGLEQREMRIDPLYYSGDRMFCDGPSQEMKQAPGLPEVQKKEVQITDLQMLASAEDFYRAEYWISGEKNHIGCKYDIFLAYYDAGNYVKFSVNAGRREFKIVECRNNIQRILKTKEIQKDYDYSVPHLFSVEKTGQHYKIISDDTFAIEADADGNMEKKTCQMGIKPYFTSLTLHYFAMVETAELLEEKLKDIVYFYEVTRAEAGRNGLTGQDGHMTMVKKMDQMSCTEEFQLNPQSLKNECVIKTGDQKIRFHVDEVKGYSIYHISNEDGQSIVVDGELLYAGKANKDFALEVKNTDIVSYRITKN